MKNILIVDDEPQIRELYEELLSSNNIKVRTAKNVNDSKNVISMLKPDLIISDIKMKDCNGIELFHWVRQKHKIPFIFMSGFSNFLDKEEAKELGAHDFLDKPVDLDQLKLTIRDILKLPKIEEADSSDVRGSDYIDDDFCKVNLSNFVTGSKLPCAIYIKIRTNHFVKLANKEDSATESNYSKYAQKVKYLHVLKADFRNYINFNLSVCKALETNKKLSKKRIDKFVEYSTHVVLENIFINNTSNESYVDSKEFAASALSILKDSNSIMSLLENLNNNSKHIYSHSLATACYAVMISKKVGWHKPSTTFKVFMAGLLHDIGFNKFSKELLEKSPALRTSDETKAFESHPTRGMEILNAIDDVPSEVVLAAYQHHEDCVGNGFPLALKKQQISPISRLIAVADCVNDRLLPTCFTLAISDYQNAIEQINRFKRKHYDPIFLDAFRDILNQK